MTFSSPPNTTAPSHLSTEPQHSKKHKKSKMFHSKAKSHAALMKKHSTNAGMRSSHSFKKNKLYPITNANGMVFNTYLKKNITEIANPHQMPTTSQSLTITANHPGVPPHTLHIFHVHLCATPHIVHQNPHDTAPPMLPCGECVALLSEPCDFSTSPQNLCATSFRSLPCTATQKFSAPSHCSHFWPWHSPC